ncbi:hypothetical protein CES85_0905 [Ochrobactrum quorumnocens]|uniref:Uncharacterized protein n=1 Tax=Ochrobactrum quorumnocens TaxID=271865 RepID=A0A248UJE8_9HYPH|nr:hypothetical protein CES85_0905 [[Ochrobactrum] quorumnocens]
MRQTKLLRAFRMVQLKQETLSRNNNENSPERELPGCADFTSQA